MTLYYILHTDPHNTRKEIFHRIIEQRAEKRANKNLLFHDFGFMVVTQS